MFQGSPSTLSAPTFFKRERGRAVLRASADFDLKYCLVPPGTYKGQQAAQRAGQLYETKVVRLLESRLRVVPQLPIYFVEEATPKVRKIVCDALVFSASDYEVAVVEVKRQHSADGFAQLQFYLPVVEKAFPWCRVSLLEICANYFPVKLPVETRVLEDLKDLWNLSRSRHNVLPLSERRLRWVMGEADHGLGTRSAEAAVR